MKIYLASPLGFNPEHNDYLRRIKAHLLAQGHELFDPWEQHHVERAIAEALQTTEGCQREELMLKAADFAGNVNADGLDACDAVLAVLDGTEPDSGTVV